MQQGGALHMKNISHVLVYQYEQNVCKTKSHAHRARAKLEYSSRKNVTEQNETANLSIVFIKIDRDLRRCTY